MESPQVLKKKEERERNQWQVKKLWSSFAIGDGKYFLFLKEVFYESVLFLIMKVVSGTILSPHANIRSQLKKISIVNILSNYHG